MINETLQVLDYIEGKNINKQILYRICYLLAKWYKENGLSDCLSIREEIFKWGNKYNINIDVYLNNCISRALEDPKRLTSDNPIRISLNDIHEIKKRFDTKNMKLLSLSVLCYAKQFGDSKKEFDLSLSALSDWIGLSYTSISGRHIKELVSFGYITRCVNIDSSSHWRGVKSKMSKFKINVPIKNEGDFTLEGNDILGLYKKIFVE